MLYPTQQVALPGPRIVSTADFRRLFHYCMWPYSLITTCLKILIDKISMCLRTGTKKTRRPSALSVPMTGYFWCKKELMISFWAVAQSICSTKKLSGQVSNPMIDCPETTAYLFRNSLPNSSNYQFN